MPPIKRIDPKPWWYWRRVHLLNTFRDVPLRNRTRIVYGRKKNPFKLWRIYKILTKWWDEFYVAIESINGIPDDTFVEDFLGKKFVLEIAASSGILNPTLLIDKIDEMKGILDGIAPYFIVGTEQPEFLPEIKTD